MHFPLLWLAAALALGILLAAWVPLESVAVLGWTALALMMLRSSVRARRGVFLSACLLMICAGVGRVALNHQAALLPIVTGEYVFEVLDFSAPPVDYALQPTAWVQIRVEHRTLRWRPPDGLTLQIGARYRSQLAVNPMGPPLNPSVFSFLRTRLSPQIWWAKSVGPTVLIQPSSHWLSTMDESRRRVAKRLGTILKGDALGVVWALALGSRSALPPALVEQWRAFGISHLLAISGLHLALVGFCLFLGIRLVLGACMWGRALAESRRLAALLTLIGMWSFCIWVNAPVSAVRACVMASAILLAIALERPQTSFNGLGAAALVMLWYDPSSLLALGAWFSFGCTWFLILANGRRSEKKSWYRSWFLMAVVPWLATLPVCALFFGELYGWSAPANLVAVQIAGWIVTPAALFTALLVGFDVSVPAGLLWILQFGLDAIAFWLQGLGKIHPNVWQMTEEMGWTSAALIWPALIVWLRKGAAPGLKVATAMGFFLLLIHGFQVWRHEPVLTFYVPYVGHGDGMVLALPNGQIMLIDAGGASHKSRFEPGEHVLAPLLRKLQTTHIDYMVLSHPDHDHMGGLHYLVDRFTVGEIWLDSAFLEHHQLQKVLESITARGGQVRAFQDLPDTLSIGRTQFDLIYPRRKHGMGQGQSTNQRSLMIRVQDQNHSLLLTGDVDAKVEQMLLDALSSTQLLKVAHHGSKTSTSQAFLDQVKPCLAVVSAARAGKGQFPHPQIVTRLEHHGVELFETGRSGALKFRPMARGWQVRSALNATKYVECSGSALTQRDGRLD